VAKSAKRSAKISKKESKRSDDVLGVTISHPDRVLYPEQDVTKRDLAEYYEAVAEWMLPHVVGRPVVLVRCPEGRKKQCFFQKHPGPSAPKSFRRFPIRESDGTDDYLVIEHAEDLVALVQMGVLEIHVWGSRIDELEKPDRLVFDLDPDPSVPWPKLVESAKQVRQFLEDVGLVTFLKTTGGKGLHLVAPIARRTEWDDAKEFCKAVAEAIVTADPEHYTSNMSKAARKGKVFIDYLRNGRGATAVAAYSTRAREGATVSVPIAWEELTAKLDPQGLNVNTVPSRLSKLKHDPWADITDVRQSITAAMRRKLSR
jgi:bifunctional non-homologous end joining protein LigD